jgi:hypothetical protein
MRPVTIDQKISEANVQETPRNHSAETDQKHRANLRQRKPRKSVPEERENNQQEAGSADEEKKTVPRPQAWLLADRLQGSITSGEEILAGNMPEEKDQPTDGHPSRRWKTPRKRSGNQ